MTSRRIFRTEFEREALHLTQRLDMTITPTARGLGLGGSTLQRWLRKAGQPGDAVFPGLGRENLAPEPAENRRLLKDVEIPP